MVPDDVHQDWGGDVGVFVSEEIAGIFDGSPIHGGVVFGEAGGDVSYGFGEDL